MSLAGRIPHINSKLEARLMAEYGAIFVTTAVPPPKIIFTGEADVSCFQASIDKLKQTFGGYEIELQAEAMNALEAAAQQAAEIGITISARSADSGRRSYQETIELWRRNVARGLGHWLAQGALSVDEVESIGRLPVPNQIETVLDIEESRHIFFSTYFDKSILYSVAAPGASQHLSMLAFDVAEYSDTTVEKVMAANGWFRTVLRDLPHFTYLGHRQSHLPDFGLQRIVREYDGNTYHFWIPGKQESQAADDDENKAPIG
jgi:hypothetical protein